jgi:hypothetical protein
LAKRLRDAVGAAPLNLTEAGFLMVSRVAKTGHPKDELKTAARQTRELAAFSVAFSFLSAHLVSVSESPRVVFFKMGTSRPMRISVAGLVLSQHLSSCDVFILLYCVG